MRRDGNDKGAEAPCQLPAVLADLQYVLLRGAVHFQGTGVRLEVALGSDEIDQLGGEVHVGLLQRRRLDGAERAGVRGAGQGIAREQGLAPGGVADLGEPWALANFAMATMATLTVVALL